MSKRAACLFEGRPGKFIGGGADADVFAFVKSACAIKRFVAEEEACFRVEAAALKLLGGAYVARYYDEWFDNDYYYLKIELGQSLRARLHKYYKKKPALPIAQARQYIRQLLEAVAHMHENGLIHRDIKLENTIIAQGRVKLIDLCTVVRPEDALPLLCGTYMFSAPEQLCAMRVGLPADIWAFATTAFEILFNCILFDIDDEYGHNYNDDLPAIYSSSDELDDEGDGEGDDTSAQSASDSDLSDACDSEYTSDSESHSNSHYDTIMTDRKIYNLLILHEKMAGPPPLHMTRWAPKYYNSDGRLKNTISITPMDVAEFIATNVFLDDDDADELTPHPHISAAFTDMIQQCIAFDPINRPSAKTLLDHTWFNNV